MNDPLTFANFEEAARTLDASGDYKVLRRLRPRDVYEAAALPDERIGVLLDVETTGLDAASDEIIELGMLKFTFTPEGRVGRIVERFEGFREPSIPIPAKVTEITGITPQMVAAQSIDPEAVERFIADAALVVAHNARFDRRFCERLWPGFAGRHWACSQTEIDWKARGHAGARLGYLLYDRGLFHDGHRAINDCEAQLELLTGAGEDGGTPLGELLENARKVKVRISAVGAPFEAKDALKARGYRWNNGDGGGHRAWCIDVEEAGTDGELAYLRGEIYKREADIPLVRLTGVERFSGRED
jgi:DNA polymerase III subunit epsilon